jgi:hypothetical protein
MAMHLRRSPGAKSDPACRYCGRTAADHRHLYPVRGTPSGPIYFDCWAHPELAKPFWGPSASHA